MPQIYKVFIVLLVGLASQLGFAQNTEETLRGALTSTKDSALVKAYLDLGKLYFLQSGKGDSLLVYGKKALLLSQSLQYEVQQLDAYKYLGTGYLANLNYAEGEKNFKAGILIAEKLSDKDALADFYYRLAVVRQNRNENNVAMDYLVTSARYSKETRNYKNEANAYYGISVIYADEKQYEKQLKYIDDAIKVIEKQDIKSPHLESIIYTDASQTYLELYKKDLDPKKESLILSYSEKALTISEQYNFEARKIANYAILSFYYELKKDYDKTEFYALKVINASNLATEASLINVYSRLINTSTIKNKKQETYSYLDSLQKLKKAARLSLKIGIANTEYIAYKRYKNYPLSLTALEEKIQLSDSFHDKEKTRAINDVEVKYQSELKDAKIENLNQKQQIIGLELSNNKAQIKRLTLLLVIAGMVILSILFISKMVQLRRMRQVNKELKEAFEKQLQLEKELSDVRDDIAQDFHDDLGTKLARISLLSNLVNGEVSIDDPKVKSKIKQITEDANGLYRGTRDFVFSLKSNSDYLEEIAVYLTDFGEDYFSKTNIKFVVEKQLSKNIKLPHYWNKQLVFIFKEAMTNALKHANCNMVKLIFTQKDEQISISCIDDGIGINDTALASSNGVLNMKKRAHKIGGVLTITAIKNQGTTITFTGNIYI